MRRVETIDDPLTQVDRSDGDDRPTVLVVDDDPAVRDVVAGMLHMHQILQATDGDEVLGILDEQPVDAVLLDIAMPRVDGIEALNRIRRHPRHRDTHVVLLTARTDEDHHLRGWLAGTDGYVTKPFDDETIVGVLSEVLQRSGEDRESVRRTERQRAALLRQVEARFI
jgi:DNA-binding response OmpR family regulator